MRDNIKEALSNLEKIEQWAIEEYDSWGAIPLTQRAIDRAREFLLNTDIEEEISLLVSSGGSLYVGWKGGNKRFL